MAKGYRGLGRAGSRALYKKRSAASKMAAKSTSRVKPPAAKSAFAKRVLAVVNRKEETKYIANGLDLFEPLATITIPGGLSSMIPILAQGVQSNQRIGQKIANAHGRVDFTFFLNPGTSSDNTASQDVKIRVYELKSKSVKNYALVSSLEANTLLDQGNQSTVDWGTTLNTLQYAQMPLSKEDWVGHFTTVHLRRNFGLANGGTESSVLTYGQIGGSCSLTWKHSGNIVYNDANDQYPSNFAPLYAMVAYNADGSKYNGQVQVYIRRHMWYKDV